MDYSSLVGRQVQTVAGCMIITNDGDKLYFNKPPMARLIAYDHLHRRFTCDLQTGDEHDGKHFMMSDYAVSMQLGIEY